MELLGVGVALFVVIGLIATIILRVCPIAQRDYFISFDVLYLCISTPILKLKWQFFMLGIVDWMRNSYCSEHFLCPWRSFWKGSRDLNHLLYIYWGYVLLKMLHNSLVRECPYILPILEKVFLILDVSPYIWRDKKLIFMLFFGSLSNIMDVNNFFSSKKISLYTPY